MDEASDTVAASVGSSVESRDGAGTVWRRVWSLPDRLVVEFVGVVTAEVRDPGDAVRFDRELPADLRRHLELDHVLPLLLARRGELVLHAGLVARAGITVVLSGPSGAGKSTLVAFCGQHGWTVGGDDGVVLYPSSPWTARPIRAGLRLTASSLDLLRWSATGRTASAGKWEFAPDAVDLRPLGPTPVAAVLTLKPVEGTEQAELVPLHGVTAHATLFRGVFDPDPGNTAALERTVRLLADLVESVPVGRLQVPRSRQGLDAAERLLSGLVTGLT